jgi:hypothetical protein
MMGAVPKTGGEFWTVENPDVYVRGEFTSEVGQKPEATLQVLSRA